MIDGTPDILTANPVGDRLKAAREERGMSLDDVANVTRVPTRHLLHIERGEWDALPAQTYSIGFARAYAKAVGLNGAEIGQELRAQLGAPQHSATIAYEPADPARVPSRSLAIVAGVIAILLAVAYMIWRSNSVPEEDPQAEAAAADTPLVAPPPAALQGANQPVQPAAAASGPVVLTAVDAVWLRVYEAGGRVLFESTLNPGDRFEVPPTAQQPQIRVGRPEALRVTVGQSPVPQLGPTGQPIGDVSLLAADLLARAQGAPAAPAPAAAAAAPAPAPIR
jgi:transcriptional regulator with XRE-family HTH domain